MKRILIVALVVLNVGLLGALVMHWTPKANAQVRGPGDYLLVMGKFQQNVDAAFVVDLGRKRMGCWKLVTQNNRSKLVTMPGSGRDLVKDFGRDGK